MNIVRQHVPHDLPLENQLARANIMAMSISPSVDVSYRGQMWEAMMSYSQGEPVIVTDTEGNLMVRSHGLRLTPKPDPTAWVILAPKTESTVTAQVKEKSVLVNFCPCYYYCSLACYSLFAANNC